MLGDFLSPSVHALPYKIFKVKNICLIIVNFKFKAKVVWTRGGQRERQGIASGKQVLASPAGLQRRVS